MLLWWHWRKCQMKILRRHSWRKISGNARLSTCVFYDASREGHRNRPSVFLFSRRQREANRVGLAKTSRAKAAIAKTTTKAARTPCGHVARAGTCRFGEACNLTWRGRIRKWRLHQARNLLQSLTRDRNRKLLHKRNRKPRPYAKRLQLETANSVSYLMTPLEYSPRFPSGRQRQSLGWPRPWKESDSRKVLNQNGPWILVPEMTRVLWIHVARGPLGMINASARTTALHDMQARILIAWLSTTPFEFTRAEV